MASVTAMFHVTLATPILVELGRTPKDFEPLTFKANVEDAAFSVQLMPLTITEPASFPDGDYEPGYLTEVAVLLKRDVRLVTEAENVMLTEHDEDLFEQALVEATRLFVRGARQRTRQWSLDTRHPVKSYVCKYLTAEQPERPPVKTRWPMAPDERRIPRYEGFYFGNLVDELDVQSWQHVQTWASNPDKEVPHEELLHDAEVFLIRRNFDVAYLFAAFAMELLIRSVCKRFLMGKGLSADQCEAILVGRRAESQVQLLSQLSNRVGTKELLGVLKRRNRLAHKGDRAVTLSEARQAITAAEGLRMLTSS